MWPNPQETEDLVTFTEWKTSVFGQCILRDMSGAKKVLY